MNESRNTEPGFRYTEVEPPNAIAHLAFCFFEFSIDGPGSEPIPHEIVPDGFVSLLIRKNRKDRSREVMLVRGLSLQTFATTVNPGDTHWGVRISPAANAAVLKCDPATVPTQPIFDPGFLSHIAVPLLRGLRGADSFSAACGVFAKVFLHLNTEIAAVDREVSQTVDRIILNYGDIRIDHLAKDLGIGKRQLERRFRNKVGITPKQYARVFSASINRDKFDRGK